MSKKRVRERMVRTGESYQQALVAMREGKPEPGGPALPYETESDLDSGESDPDCGESRAYKAAKRLGIVSGDFLGGDEIPSFEDAFGYTPGDQ